MVTENVDSARSWGIINGTVGTVAGYLSADGGRTITHVLIRPDQPLRNMPPFKFKISLDRRNGPMEEEITMEYTWPLGSRSSTLSVHSRNDR